jgi:hypothetical protein
MFKMLTLRKAPYSQSVMLTVTKEKKDTNTYAVFTIGKGSVISETEQSSAQEWLGNLASMNYKVSEEKESEMTAKPPTVDVKSSAGEPLY